MSTTTEVKPTKTIAPADLKRLREYRPSNRWFAGVLHYALVDNDYEFLSVALTRYRTVARRAALANLRQEALEAEQTLELQAWTALHSSTTEPEDLSAFAKIVKDLSLARAYSAAFNTFEHSTPGSTRNPMYSNSSLTGRHIIEAEKWLDRETQERRLMVGKRIFLDSRKQELQILMGQEPIALPDRNVVSYILRWYESERQNFRNLIDPEVNIQIMGINGEPLEGKDREKYVKALGEALAMDYENGAPSE